MKNDLSLYEGCRQKMESGDVIAFQGRDLGARLIRLVTRSPYSHVGLVVRIRAIDVDRVFIAESSTGGGVVLVPLSRKLENYPGKAWWLELKIRQLGLTEGSEAQKQLAEIHKWAMNELGKKYDFGLIRALVRWLVLRRLSPQSNAEQYICSEFVVEGFKHCALLPSGFSAALTPREVCDLPVFSAPVRVI